MNCMKVAHLQRADQPASNFSALQRERPEISQRETMDMFAEQNNKQNNHRHSPAESSRDCSPFYPEFGKTELTKISE